MKQRILLIAGMIGISVSAAAADPVRMAQAIPGVMQGEVVAIVRSHGYMPISPIVRRGDSYVLRASAPDGREMRVIVAARSGEIVSAQPVVPAGPAYAAGHVPPPILHDGDRPMRRPLAAVPNAPQRAPHPDMQASLQPGPLSSEPPVVMREERGEHGLLPPPPERYQSRVAPVAPAPAPKPVAKPAPVKRAAAPPLPKPRPEIEKPAVEANARPDAQPAPTPAPEAKPAASAPPPATPAPMPEGKVDPRSLPH